MSSILTQTLFGSLLDSPAVVETTAAILERAIPVIREHFTLTAAEISKAYRDSCRYSFVAIRIGLESPDSLIKKVRYPNITREFARQVETDYFQPFSEQHDALRNTLIKSLKKWAKNSDKLFAIKEITEEDLSAFIVQRENAAISDLILAQMAKIEAVDEGLAAFLQFKGLLGDSVLFFFREQLRTDSRVQATQMALQQENILANLGRQQAQFSDFQKQFAAQSDEVLDWAKSGYAVFYEILEEVVVKVDEVLSSQQQSNSAQVDYRDGTVQYSNENQELLKALLAKWQDLSPKEPLYGQVSNKLGRALLSSNALQEAGQLFQRLIAESESVDDKALAYFNLFHVCWRQAVIAETVAEKEMYFAQALEALNQAISLSNGKYALHDINKYFPITKMLGAGGMGCVFLCENQNKLLKNELTKTKYLQVVVKCFWENIIGDLDTVFNEPFLMDGLASVPRPLECGYADNQQRIKPYFVMEYIDGAIDGEVWLEKNGCLDLMTGLEVALQLAQILEQAHDKKNICHLDLKPANLLLKEEKDKILVKVIDFGLARVSTVLSVQTLHQSGATVLGKVIMGYTFDYASPEQRSGQLGGKKSDVFSFGKTMYKLWTGKQPHTFRERSLPNVVELRDLLYDCVEEKLNERPNATDLVKNLTAIIEEVAKPSQPVEKPQEPVIEPKPPEPVKPVVKGKPPKSVAKPKNISWQQACEKDTIAAYEAYLNDKNAPEKYATIAQQRIQVLKQEIDDSIWDEVHQKNTIEAYQAYLDGNTLKNYVKEAKKQIQIVGKNDDKTAWQQACEKNTIEAYQAYLNGNTLKNHAKEVQEQIQILEKNDDETAWRQACEKNTIEAYQAYLDDNTLKNHAKQAEKHLEDEEAWQWTCKRNTKTAYRAYLENNTLKNHAQEAKKYIEHLNSPFIKLDHQGKKLPYPASIWSGVKDNKTGLIWEVKSNDKDNLHYKNDRYTWYNTDQTSNDGSDGYDNEIDCRNCYGYQAGKTSTYCNTQAYAARVNAENYCGFNDWRMPTKEELISLIDSSKENPAINTDYFPNTKSSEYWSGSPLAGNPYGAWDVGFNDGDDDYGNRNSCRHVRLVRGGQ